MELAETVIKVEFPSFDVLANLSLFSQHGLQDAEQGVAFERLCQTYGVCVENLKAEFAEVEPFAKNIMTTEKKNSGQAWMEAFGKVGKNAMEK